MSSFFYLSQTLSLLSNPSWKKETGLWKKNFKNPAHVLSQRVWIVAPILWNPAFLTLFRTFLHFLLLHVLALFYFSGTFCLKKNHVSCVTSHMSHVMCDMSHITWHMSHVTCHLPPVDWFQIQKKPISNHGQKHHLNHAILMSFWI